MSENKYEKYLGLSKYQDSLLLQTKKSTFLQLFFFCGVLTIIFAIISLFSIAVLYFIKATMLIIPVLRIYTTFLVAYILLIVSEVLMFNCTEHVAYLPKDNLIKVDEEIYSVDNSSIKTKPLFKFGYDRTSWIHNQGIGDDFIAIITFNAEGKKFNVLGCCLADGHKKAISDSVYNPRLLYFNMIIYPILILCFMAYFYNIH